MKTIKTTILGLATILIASCSSNESEKFTCSLKLNEYKKVEYVYTNSTKTDGYVLNQTLQSNITDCSLAGKEKLNSKPQEVIDYPNGSGGDLKKVIVSYKQKYE